MCALGTVRVGVFLSFGAKTFYIDLVVGKRNEIGILELSTHLKK